MHSEYIEQRNGGYYVAGTRISLDSVVYSFNEGDSPEAIQENFPLLKRSQIYGAIAFYLDHKPEIDQYLEDTRREFEADTIPPKPIPFSGRKFSGPGPKWVSPVLEHSLSGG